MRAVHTFDIRCFCRQRPTIFRRHDRTENKISVDAAICMREITAHLQVDVVVLRMIESAMHPRNISMSKMDNDSILVGVSSEAGVLCQ